MLWYDEVVKRLWLYYIYLVLIWGSFRYFIRLPEVIEELWFKPMLWLVPLFWWNLALKEKIVMFGKKWGESLILGLVMGVGYFVVLRFNNWGNFQFDFNLMGVAVATAVTEELTFSGFVAGYLEKIQKGRWFNLIIVGLMAVIIRLPILIFVYQAGGIEVLGALVITLVSGVIGAWIRVKSENVAGSILARLGMNLAVLG
ncbi:MAG TPA: CPBP family glutamic-type intramembrane protease [Spirochaetia bacterium]|nr:CPBP family glutamic-type intramembrane protease [Spirochaetia bacterium]